YQDNKVKLMGVADLKRAGVVPEVPTLSEAGLPGFKSITWFGLVAPPATPAALAEKINRDAVEILNGKDVGDMLRKMSLETGATAPTDTARFFRERTAGVNKGVQGGGNGPAVAAARQTKARRSRQQPRLAIGAQRAGMKRHAAEFERRGALRPQRLEQLLDPDEQRIEAAE